MKGIIVTAIGVVTVTVFPNNPDTIFIDHMLTTLTRFLLPEISFTVIGIIARFGYVIFRETKLRRNTVLLAGHMISER